MFYFFVILILRLLLDILLLLLFFFKFQAGITTTLNSRCSVLAAANSIFGRWDETKAEENIDFMPTILSRFDTIFIVKDEHNPERDTTLGKKYAFKKSNNSELKKKNQLVVMVLKIIFSIAKHVMNVHMNAGAASTDMQVKKKIIFNFTNDLLFL